MKTSPCFLIKLVILCLGFLPVKDAGAALIAGWDFQTGTAIGSSGSVQTRYSANFGQGTIWMDGSHGSSAWNPASGSTLQQLGSISGTLVNTNGSSFSTSTSGPGGIVLRQPQNAYANGADTNGFSLVFEISMANYQSLQISYAYRRNSGGAYNSLVWQYSTDATAWTTFDTILYSAADPVSAWTSQSVAGLDALNGNGTAYIRVVFSEATVNPSSSRDYAVDNLQFNATAVPEPTSSALLMTGLFILGACLLKRRRGHGPLVR